ncbi:EAL domain-containing protein [Micromonospora sp. NPDC048063]|uniref:EAL domain-containing protein n=1 Tax=Micromonospora sp. NPDC048063 TaxID=3364256 RepID=UPI00371A8B96
MGTALMAVGAAFSVPLPSQMPIRITLTPTACLVCATALPAPWVILCTAVGVTAARLVTRYPQSSGFHKTIHNTSMDIVAAGLAGLVMYAFGIRLSFDAAPEDLNLPRHLLGLIVAAVAVLVFEECVTTMAVRWATMNPFLTVLRYLWRTRLIVGVAEIIMAAAVTVVTGLDKRAMIALPALMLALHLAVTFRLRIRQERRAWEHLAALSDALSARDLDVVLHTAAAGAVDLVNAQSAEIEVSDGRRLVRASGDAGDARVVYDGPAADVPSHASDVRLTMRYEIGSDTSSLHGELRLYFSGPRRVLPAHERATLRAFAATLSTSLDTAHAYGLLAEEARRHETAATHDPDTSLPNRAALLSRMAETSASPAHVVAIRLENYHFLVDAIGRDQSLELLNELAVRLNNVTRDTASAVARVGDAEFALVMWGVTADAAYQRACWAVAALRRGVRLDRGSVAVRASAGMASSGHEDAVGLLDAAERVMWRAIRRGQDRLVSYQAGPVRGSSLAQELSDARMSISFEPIVDLVSGRITMVQSVPRWLYSRHDVLAADEYVYQLVDDQEYLETLARAVVIRSLSAASTWRDVLPHAALIVPVPARALTPNFAEGLRDLLHEHAVPGSSLVLALNQPTDLHTREATDKVRQYGVRLLLENYGSTQSSIDSLNAAAWSYLRVHAAYALDAGWRPARSVIRAAVDVAIDLDLSVIAPGIAAEEERRELASLGCTLGSGPLVGGEMFASQVRRHAALWQPTALRTGGRVVRLHRAG